MFHYRATTTRIWLFVAIPCTPRDKGNFLQGRALFKRDPLVYVLTSEVRLKQGSAFFCVCVMFVVAANIGSFTMYLLTGLTYWSPYAALAHRFRQRCAADRAVGIARRRFYPDAVKDIRVVSVSV
jgi:hypothetical protein